MEFEIEKNKNLAKYLKSINCDEISLRSALEKVFEEIAPQEYSAHLIFTGNKQIQALNKQFRSLDKPTDVLSFDYGQPDNFGEIYISIDYIVSTLHEAAEEGFVLKEILRMVVHGGLHLLGYEHVGYFDESKFDARPLPKSAFGIYYKEKNVEKMYIEQEWILNMLFVELNLK